MKTQEYSQASVDHPERCEDAILLLTPEGKAPVFAVIDGMGGQQHQLADGTMITGHDASQWVRNVLVEDLAMLPPEIDASPKGEAETKVIAAVMRAHQSVRRELNNEDQYAAGNRVGAVITVVVVCENGARLLTVQVGDTRGYLYSEGELIQLCPDEDNIEYFIRQGLLSPDDGDRISTILNSYNGIDEPETEGTVTIAGSPYDLYIAWRWFMVGNTVLNIPAANIVINALGVHAENPLPLTSRIEVAPADTIFLCSDGLYKNLSEAEMLDGLGKGDQAAQVLGEAALERSKTPANRRSTQDDISVVIAQW
ncbi:MAG: protein phosphatase 2C domain-containing protein [Chloroflexota bacterium]